MAQPVATAAATAGGNPLTRVFFLFFVLSYTCILALGAVVLLLWVAMIVLPGRSNAPTRAASATTRRRWRAAPVAAHVPALTPRALAPATATIRTHELRRSVCCP